MTTLADLNNLKQSLQSVSSTAVDPKTGQAITKDPSEKRKNTIDAVTDLLKSLLDGKSVDLIKANSSSAIGIVGIGKSGAGNNKYYPSFNLRTPIVEVSINNIPLYPEKLDLDTNKRVNSRMNFKSFNLTLPMGGTEKSITGSISFFTKNPQEILDAIGPIGVDGNSMDTSPFATGGFPTMKLKFGWAFSDSSSPTNMSEALSPTLNLLITNISMTDPGTQGTTFTLSLQELGTVVLEHSTDDILLLSDYPQQQLRVLLEGLLHVRLFTLDDLFYFDKNQTSDWGVGLPTPANNAVITPLTTTPLTSTINGGQGTTSTIPANFSPDGTTGLAGITGSVFKTSVQGLPIQASQQNQITAMPPTVISTNFGGTKSFAAAGAQLTTSVMPNSNQQVAVATAQTAPISTVSAETFFTTNPSSAIGVNGKSFFNVAQELAARCRCKWYPHSNLATAADIKETTSATTRLNTLASDLKAVQAIQKLRPILTKTDIAQLKDEAVRQGATNMSSGATNVAIQAVLVDELRKSLARLSTKSTLYWIPNVPKGWKTSGSDFYSTGIDPSGAPVEYEEGAFFLLPDVLDDYDIFLADLPIQYGPGASTLPYFYGSGQNVFQTSVNGVGGAKMFGEVISLDVNHSSLLVALSKSAQEKRAYAVNGQWMGQQAAASGYVNQQADNIDRSGDSTKLTDAEQKAINEKGQAIVANKAAKILAATRRFKGSLASGSSGGVRVFDRDDITGENKSNPVSDQPTTEPTGAAQSTSYDIKTRVASFLRYPTQGKITILGDPNLIRLGPGCFELFSYYPVEHDATGVVTQELNALTSGVFFVTSIEHSIQGEQFITTMQGSKIIDPVNVPSSITNKALQSLLSLPKGSSSPPSTQKPETITDTLNQFNTIDLNKELFTKGFFAQELKTAFDTYKSTSQHMPPTTQK